MIRQTYTTVCALKEGIREGERLYESSRAVNNGWRFTARTKSCVKWAVKKNKNFEQKNEDFSEFVNSFDFGTIF